MVSDVNNGQNRHNEIVDNTALLALRTARSGMMSGITSPARPWFRLATEDSDLNEYTPVKDWLYTVTNRMLDVFRKSNLYQGLPNVYGDMLGFGTSAIYMEEDFKTVVRFYAFPIGSYKIANNAIGKVEVWMRDFRMTVRQLIEKWGRPEGSKDIDWSRFSTHVKQQWEQRQYETWIDVCHVIEPNEDYRPDSALAKHKRFSSCYYEVGSSNGQSFGYLSGPDVDKYLSESGYDFFPVLCPRWEVTGEDSYGTNCPGMEVYGDVKALQVMQKRKAQAIEKMVNPPMKGPSSLRTVKTSILPGDINYDDTKDTGGGLRPVHEVNPRVQELVYDIQETQARVKRGLFEDLFLMLANDPKTSRTAYEISVREQERLLVLGPVYEQLNQDLLDPLVNNTFQLMLRQSTDLQGNWLDNAILPRPPEELNGKDLKIEYVSVMAQAQKAAGISGIERFAGFASQIIASSPETADKINPDQIIDIYADMTSVPPGVVRSDEEAAERRAGRAKAQQAQAQAEMIKTGASAAKDLSQAQVGEENALTRLINASQAGQLTGT
jgi:hypothetical protein